MTSPTDTSPTPAAATPATAPAAAAPLPRPRIRTGAVLWGLTLVAASVVVLWIATDPGQRDDAVDAVTSLDAFGWTIVGVIAVGGMCTLLAAAAVIRQAQRRLSR